MLLAWFCHGDSLLLVRPGTFSTRETSRQKFCFWRVTIWQPDNCSRTENTTKYFGAQPEHILSENQPLEEYNFTCKTMGLGFVNDFVWEKEQSGKVAKEKA